MFARDTSGRVGSEARGECREIGYLSRGTAKLPVAQRAGGILSGDIIVPGTWRVTGCQFGEDAAAFASPFSSKRASKIEARGWRPSDDDVPDI